MYTLYRLQDMEKDRKKMMKETKYLPMFERGRKKREILKKRTEVTHTGYKWWWIV